jgi:bacteriocin-like protein
MKTISSKGIKETLSECELKNVKGGCEPDCECDKITACKGKKEGDTCCFVDESGVTQHGTCQTTPFSSRHCSDFHQ